MNFATKKAYFPTNCVIKQLFLTHAHKPNLDFLSANLFGSFSLALFFTWNCGWPTFQESDQFSLERVADKQRLAVERCWRILYFFFTFRFTFWALFGTQLTNIILKYVFLIIQDVRSQFTTRSLKHRFYFENSRGRLNELCAKISYSSVTLNKIEGAEINLHTTIRLSQIPTIGF